MAVKATQTDASNITAGFFKCKTDFDSVRNPSKLCRSSGPAIDKLNECLTQYGSFIDSFKGLYESTNGYLKTATQNIDNVENELSGKGNKS